MSETKKSTSKKEVPTPEKGGTKRLSHKQKGFIKDIAGGMTGTQAALNNYDTKDERVAAVIASENLTKPNIVNALADAFPDELLKNKHLELLNASRLEHMVFPTFNSDSDEGQDEEFDDLEELENKGEKFGEQLTDAQIRELLASVNCTVRKIVHGEQARHVYFWAADNQAQDKALDKAYKIRGLYAAEKRELSGANGQPLFTNEQQQKSADAIASYLAGNTD